MAELDAGRVEIEAIEGDLPTPNYTIQTLRALRSRRPLQRWGLILGRDQIDQFVFWLLPREIVELASLLVVERGDGLNFENVVGGLATELGLKAKALGPTSWMWEGLSTGFYALPGAVSKAASRWIRKDPKAALKKAWITAQLAHYIEFNRLYTEEEV